jgi:hypothetical protein
MADADFARATIVKAQNGFTVVVVLRRGEQIDAWSLDSFESFKEAEDAVKAFARRYNLPWGQVDVISP